MAALRSTLRMLSHGSSVSTAAAYMGGRGMELNQVLHSAAPPLPAMAPPVHTAAIRNFEGFRRFSTGFGESAHKSERGKRAWWKRVKDQVKYRIQNVDPEEEGEFTLCMHCSFWGHRLPSSSEDSFKDEDANWVIKQPG